MGAESHWSYSSSYRRKEEKALPPLVVWIDALIVGFSIIMVASGLAFVWGVMGILNWAHGQLYMVAAFLVFSMYARAGLNYFLVLVITIVVIGAVGIAIERILIRPVANKGFLAASVVTMGLSFALQGFITVVYGPSLKAVPEVFSGKVSIGGVFVSWQRIVVVAIAIVAMLGLYYLINRTRMGLAMRASAQDGTVAGLFGVRTGRLFAVVMFVGSALAGLGGGLLAPVYSVDPTIGGRPLTLALLAIVLGGLGSFKGSVIGGLLFGFASIMLAYYIGTWYELILFGIIILVILFRPQGMFGKAEARV